MNIATLKTKLTTGRTLASITLTVGRLHFTLQLTVGSANDNSIKLIERGYKQLARDIGREVREGGSTSINRVGMSGNRMYTDGTLPVR